MIKPFMDINCKYEIEFRKYYNCLVSKIFQNLKNFSGDQQQKSIDRQIVLPCWPGENY